MVWMCPLEKRVGNWNPQSNTLGKWSLMRNVWTATALHLWTDWSHYSVNKTLFSACFPVLRIELKECWTKPFKFLFWNRYLTEFPSLAASFWSSCLSLWGYQETGLTRVHYHSAKFVLNKRMRWDSSSYPLSASAVEQHSKKIIARCWHFDLGLPGCRTVKNTFIFSTNYVVSGLLSQQHKIN